MVKKYMKSNESVRFLFKKEPPKEMGEIINDGQNLFGTTIRIIWKVFTNIRVYYSNTSGDFDSTGFGTFCWHFDRGYRLQVKLDE
jgi:hypothetical protein